MRSTWNHRFAAGRGPRQRGVAAVEFALVAFLFFALLWGILTYGFIFATQQTLTLAAENGARAALHYQVAPDQPTAIALRVAAARQAAENSLAWLQAINLAPAYVPSQNVQVGSQPCSYNAALQCFSVDVTYPYKQRPLFPPLPAFGLIAPSELKGKATMQVDPDNLVLSPQA